VELPPARTERKRQLTAAAKALLPDYAAGGELTILMALDSEDFSMRRGEVWLINLDPTVGAEIKKTRPAIIVN